MSRKAFLSTSTLSLRKLALIVVLVGTLGFVLLGGEEANTGPDPVIATHAARVSNQVALQSKPSGDLRTARWPDFSLESVLAANPFESIHHSKPSLSTPDASFTATSSAHASKAKPEGDSESGPQAATSSKLQRILQQRQYDKVDIIYQNEAERVAVIDSRLVRVGDVLSDGRVVAITPNSVIIEGVFLD